MTDAYSLLLSGFGLLILFLGLAGSVLPIVPGPFLIWFGAFLWAWGNGFEQIGWFTLVVLGLLAVAAWSTDLFLNTIVSRQAGASWKAIGGAILGGFIGSLLLSGWIPILGTLLGAAAGAVVGMWTVEYWDKRDYAAALRAVRAYVTSMALAAGIELMLSITMLTIFVWQAFL